MAPAASRALAAAALAGLLGSGVRADDPPPSVGLTSASIGINGVFPYLAQTANAGDDVRSENGHGGAWVRGGGGDRAGAAGSPMLSRGWRRPGAPAA